mgnify:CR=1 FL=1
MQQVPNLNNMRQILELFDTLTYQEKGAVLTAFLLTEGTGLAISYLSALVCVICGVSSAETKEDVSYEKVKNLINQFNESTINMLKEENTKNMILHYFDQVQSNETKTH